MQRFSTHDRKCNHSGENKQIQLKRKNKTDISFAEETPFPVGCELGNKKARYYLIHHNLPSSKYALCQKVNLEKIYIINQSNSEIRVNFMNRTIAK